MIISLIAAMSENRVIGLKNDLPWHLPDDMKFFQSTTKHHIVVMGRKNFESLPPKFRPLPNRTNVILTRQLNYAVEGCIVHNNIEEAVNYARIKGEEELFIIGGGQIYEQSIGLANKIYLTEINSKLEGDTYFPELDDTWIETSRRHHPSDDRHKYSFDFVIYEKKV